MEKPTNPRIINILSGATAEPKSAKCSVDGDRYVKWEIGNKETRDWRVIFGPHAPVDTKVAWPGGRPRKVVVNGKEKFVDSDTLVLYKQRPEDIGHVKYVIVGLTDEGLKHDDPELIVEP